MKSKFLLVGFLGLSLAVFGQSNADQKQAAASHEVKAPRDLATGQASGKRTSQASGVAAGDVNGDGATALRESPSKASLGKTSVRVGSSDAASANGATEIRESPSKASDGKTSVHAADLDGDGKADRAAGNGPRQTTSQDGTFNTSSDVKAPRDLATGQASGKRQHAPVTITKESDKGPK